MFVDVYISSANYPKCYVNAITYHYVTTTDENGISHTRLDHISETGYIWTGRTSSTHTEEIPQAQKLDKLYDLLKGNMGRAKWRNNNQLRLAQVLAEQAAKQRAAEMNQRFLEALRKALLGVDPDDPDVRAILENDYIKNLLSSLRSYDTPGAPLTPEVKALRQLDDEASSDLSWWQQFFNPTFDLDAQRFELSPLSTFLLEHPEFLLGPASLARQAVKTAACIALQRVAPKLLAASGAALAWENFASFMKGGKDAVKKTTAGEAKTQKIDDDLKKYMDYAKHKGAGYANNLNNKLRLDAELAFKQAGILDDFGKLTAKAVQNAKRINLAEGEIKNEAVIKILTKDGSKITDWGKFTTESVKLGNGQKKQIHFYKNLKNGKVDYETIDYKIKNDISIAKGVK